MSRTSRVAIRLAACIALLLSSVIGRANDGAAGLDGGDLVFKNIKGVVMERESLHISADEVRVEYRFYNKTSTDIRTVVAFPVVYPLEGDLNFDPEGRNPMKFTVTVDGKSVAFDTKTTQSRDHVELTHFWTQSFPKGSRVHIGHTYQPVFDTGVLYGMDAALDGADWDEFFGGPLIKDFCATRAQVGWIKKRQLEYKALTYILRTARTWDGPIGEFELTIDKGTSPRVFLCTELDLKKVRAANSFRAVEKNYLPKEDLKIAFVGQYEL